MRQRRSEPSRSQGGSSGARTRQASPGTARSTRVTSTQAGRPRKRPVPGRRAPDGSVTSTSGAPRAARGWAASGPAGGAASARDSSSGRPGGARKAPRGKLARAAELARRPVARRPRYGLRRLAFALVVVLLVVGAGAGAVAGTAWVRQTIRAQDQERAAAQAHTVYPDPVACEPADLATEVSGPEAVSEGSGATFVLTVTNTSDLSCLLDAGGSSLGILVTSGTEQIWRSTVCPVDDSQRSLLLGPGDATEVTLSWNGYVATSDCAVAQAPAPGAQEQASLTPEPGSQGTPQETTDGPTPSGADGSPDPAASPTDGAASAEGGELAQSPGASAAGQVAAAGVYRFRAVLGEEDLGEDTVFVVVQ